MPQTLLALLAMIVASLVSFNQQRNAITTYESMLDHEVEMAATGMLMHVMELVGGRSFDEQSSPASIFASQTVPTLPEQFSSVSLFGANDRGSEGCDLENAYLTPECDDIDDLDGIRDAVVLARFTNGRSLEFRIDVDVDYVAEGEVQTVSAVPTRNKRVTVTVRNSFLPHGQVVLERVFSYDSIKAEMNYETIYGPLGI